MILLWRITSRCNFSCGFCAFDQRLKLPRLSVDPDEVERIARLAACHARARGERLLLSWLGGEPLLWPPLLDLSERLASEPGIALSMTSNGTRLHKAETRRRILSSFSELTLSLDGPATLHDRLRGVNGSFDQARAAIIALARERAEQGKVIKLRVNMVLMRDTLPHFAALCTMLANWGVDEITFNQLGGRDRPEFYPGQRLLPADAARLVTLVPEVRARLAEQGVRLCAGPDYLRRIVASSAGEPLAVADCAPGEAFIFVDERGRAAPCSFTLDEFGVPLREIETPADFAALPARFRAARADASAPICGDCPSTQQFGKFAA
jgi:MoaA/NifB/PqqE/SkfB family radical SAM enzyme